MGPHLPVGRSQSADQRRPRHGYRADQGHAKRPVSSGAGAPHHAGVGAARVGIGDAGSEELIGSEESLSPALSPPCGPLFRPSRRDHCGESDPGKGGKGCPDPCPPLPSPVPHQRPKGGGRSHHQHPSRAARRDAGREGDPRGAASLRLFRSGRGKSVLSRFRCAVSWKS